jgi:hypothetical protein
MARNVINERLIDSVTPGKQIIRGNLVTDNPVIQHTLFISVLIAVSGTSGNQRTPLTFLTLGHYPQTTSR